ncbi:MAG TPA: sigma-70 family RNA polymerase sigma factor [Planctomycetota bacterium]|nr:sigma-70 family RNA polymerase sigma factor [Planctomycetota bacterium]
MDPDAEELLAHAAQVRQLARRLLRDPHAAQDAEQATWLAALEHGPAPGRPAGPWLARTLRNFAWRGLRTGARRRSREEAAARAEAVPSAAELCERAELHRELVEAVVGLEEPFRSAILLRYFEGLPPREIARRLGVPVRTVQSRLARGLERLRARLVRRHGGHGAWLLAWSGLRRPVAAPVAVGVAGVVLVSTKMKIAALVALVVALAAIRIAWRWGDPATPAGSAGAAAPVDLVSVEKEREPESRVDADDAQRRPVRAPPADLPAAPEIVDTTLRGFVVDTRGSPVQGALVEALVHPLAGTELRSFDFESKLSTRVLANATSGEDGSFELDLERDRPVHLRAGAKGFGQAFARDRRAGQEVTLVLKDPSVLSGRVSRAEGGDPVAGALVWVRHGEGMEFESESRTDLSGEWRSEGLTPGTVGLIVVPEHQSPTRYEELLLGAGQERRHNVEVVSGMTIHGHVRDAVSGAPIEGAEVSAWSFLRKNVLTDAGGAYRIEGVKTWQMSEVCARAPGYGRSEKSAGAMEGTVELDFDLAPGLRAVGRVVGPAGEPVADAYVAAIAFGGEPGLSRRDWIASRTGADGAFELQPLRRDLPHTLIVRAEGLSTRHCEFPESESALEVVDFGEVKLGVPASIEGVVVLAEGSPIRGALVFAQASNRQASRAAFPDERVVVTDEIGRFRHQDLPGGTHYVWVEAPGYGLAPEPLRVDLEDGEHRGGLRIEFPRALSISGRVIGPDGETFSDIHVQLHGGAGTGPRPRTAHDGSFAFHGVTPGTYWLTAEAPAARPEGARPLGRGILTDVPAGSGGLELVLPHLVEITGLVVDAQGAPVEHALVSVAGKLRHVVSGTGLTGPTGTFRLEVPEGARLDLWAQRMEPKPGTRLGRAPLDSPAATAPGVAAGSTGIVLRLP